MRKKGVVLQPFLAFPLMLYQQQLWSGLQRVELLMSVPGLALCT
jgi:hypothetical protein